MTNQSESSTAQTVKQKLIDLYLSCRGSRKLVLLIVAIALLLDNMLLTSVVPIIPSYLYQLHHEKDMVVLNETLRTSTISPAEANRQRMLASNSEKPSLLQVYAANGSQRGPELGPMCPCREGAEGFTGRRADELISTTTQMTTTTEAVPTTTPTPEKQLRHEELLNENLEVGIIFAAKPVVQAITNPFIGPLTNRIGYTIPMFAGFVIMFLSTLIFAVGNTYPILFMARSMQGVGSACTSVAGMGMLADRYPDDRERGNAMAVALGGLALGVLIGPPFGGVMYEFIGKASPFLVLAFLALLDGLLQLLVLQPKVVRDEQQGASLLTLVKDPYILVAAGAITFANMGIAILEPSLPLWMMDTMDSSNWEQGAAFLPASISYLIGTNVFGPLGHRMGRWLAAMVGLISIGFSLMLIPLAHSVTDLIIPNAVIGFAIGMVDSSMMPMLGYLVDIRHTSVYGSVYAIGDVAFCAGFAVGPFLSGTVARAFGFEGLVIVTAFICFLFSPFLLLLRSPPILNEDQALLHESCVRYVNYTNDETPEEEDVRKIVPQTLVP